MEASSHNPDIILLDLGLPDMDGIKILNRVIPERLVTFIPGLIVIKSIMNFVGATELTVVSHGVREGYMIENGILRGSGIDEFRDEQQSLCK